MQEDRTGVIYRKEALQEVGDKEEAIEENIAEVLIGRRTEQNLCDMKEAIHEDKTEFRNM